MRPDDYTLGQFAALDQPAWQAPPQRLEEWPGAERPSATNWMMGETAALGDYIPTPPSNILGDIATSMVDYAKRPGQTMAPNPHPQGSEEEQFYEDQRRSNTYRIAPEAAMDIAGAGTPFAVKGGLGMAGGKMIAPGALAATSEYRPPFYSAVEQAVQGAKQNAAPGQQWAGFLRNQPGVKPEEVEALKLGKLFEQPGSVPKQAVLGEIAANRVNVGEVVKGGNEYELLDKLAQQHYGKDFAWVPVDQQRLLRNLAQTEHGQTKFSAYTLPGGENYREMLLTLPTADAPKASRMTALEGKLRNAGDYDTHEVNAMRAEYKRLADETRASGTFKSPHYDEPNILAHVRYNDRVIDGKKTLFVEEVQSDWHQKGKREGYKQELTPAERQERHDIYGLPERVRTPEQQRRMEELDIRAGSGSSVPDAPFKTTWPELAMKRIIREAAEKGYDKVAWTPGSVQAERYDLSKQINALKVQRLATREGDLYEVFATPKNGEQIRLGAKTKDELPDIVGKEMAQRIANNAEHHQNYTGLDLKVGGEGMKGFYDEILPATVNRLVKKHGGRVTQGAVPQEYRVMSAGPENWRVVGPDKQGLRDARGEPRIFKTEADAKAAAASMPGLTAHTIDITPSLRAAAMKGFPLFSAGGVAATGIMGEMARQDDYRQ